jgi:pilus assembly protein CpaF
MWGYLSSDHKKSFFPIRERETLGSAKSNTVCLDDKSIQAIHAQIIVKENVCHIKNYELKQSKILKHDNTIALGHYQLLVGEIENFWKKHKHEISSTFKSHLESSSQQDLKKALKAVSRIWFFGRELPSFLEKELEAEFQELSLISPVERLLNDEEISDILVEAFDKIWIERQGLLVLSSERFSNLETYKVYLENLLSSLEKNIDESTPFVDFVLNDGSRGHLIGPPITNGSQYLSIRKVRRNLMTLEDLFERDMFSSIALEKIRKYILEGKNFIISGATGSGKTSLLKAMLLECPQSERLVVIEDTPEIKINRLNSVFLNTRADKSSQFSEISLRDLVRQSLRMRPNRIVIGEVRGKEAIDLLFAMNTGHRGCAGSLHANSARDALFRLEGLVRLSSSALSESVTRDLIARNIHIVLHCEKNKQGKRLLKEIGLVHGIDQGRLLLEVQEV